MLVFREKKMAQMQCPARKSPPFRALGIKILAAIVNFGMQLWKLIHVDIKEEVQGPTAVIYGRVQRSSLAARHAPGFIMFVLLQHALFSPQFEYYSSLAITQRRRIMAHSMPT